MDRHKLSFFLPVVQKLTDSVGCQQLVELHLECRRERVPIVSFFLLQKKIIEFRDDRERATGVSPTQPFVTSCYCLFLKWPHICFCSLLRYKSQPVESVDSDYTLLTLGRSITDGFRQILPVRQEDPLRRVLHLFGASVLFFFFGLYRRVHMSATLSVIAPLDLLLPSVIDPCGAGRVERAAAGSIPNSRVTDEMKSERKRERESCLFSPTWTSRRN